MCWVISVDFGNPYQGFHDNVRSEKEIEKLNGSRSVPPVPADADPFQLGKVAPISGKNLALQRGRGAVVLEGLPLMILKNREQVEASLLELSEHNS